MIAAGEGKISFLYSHSRVLTHTHTHTLWKCFSFCLMCMNALSAHMYMFCMCAWCQWRSEVLDALKLELRMVVSCHVDAETPNRVFCMRNACSLLLSLLSSHQIIISFQGSTRAPCLLCVLWLFSFLFCCCLFCLFFNERKRTGS